MAKPPVLIKQSRRKEYEHLKYSYPETFAALIRAADEAPGFKLPETSEAPPGTGLCRPPPSQRGRSSRGGTGAVRQVDSDALLAMSEDELRDHLSELACNRLQTALSGRSRASRSGAPSRLATGQSQAPPRSPGGTVLLPQVASSPALLASGAAPGQFRNTAPWYRSRPCTSVQELEPAKQALALRKGRERNYGGRLFDPVDPMVWEPTGSVLRAPPRRIPPPKEVAPVPPDTGIQRKIAKEKEEQHMLSVKTGFGHRKCRRDDGGVFLGSETFEKIGCTTPERLYV